MSDSSFPFFKCFKTDKHIYLYDPGTNHVLQVDKLDYDIFIKHYVEKNNNHELVDFVRQEGLDHEPQKYVQNIINHFDSLIKNKNLFTPPIRILPRSGRKNIKEIIRGGLRGVCFEVTRECNLRCDYCIWKHDKHENKAYSHQKLSIEDGKRCIDYIVANSSLRYEIAEKYFYYDFLREGIFMFDDLIHISFYGGEPLLNFEFIKSICLYCEEITQHGGPSFAYHVTTNFTIITLEQMNFFIDYNFYVSISLDGPEEVNNRYRKFESGQGTFHAIMRNIDRYRELLGNKGKSTSLSYIAVLAPPSMFADLIQFFDKLANKYNDNFTFTNYTEIPYFCEKNPCPNQWIKDHEIREHILSEGIHWIETKETELDISVHAKKSIRNLMDVFINRNILMQGFCPHKGTIRNGCCFPTSRLYLSCDKIFYPCERLFHNQEYEIGDLDHGLSVEKIFNLIKREHEKTKNHCGSCWAIRFCFNCFNILDCDEIGEICNMCRTSIEDSMLFSLRVLENHMIDMRKLV